MKKQRLRDALWLALGLAILANSRPFEGLVVSIPVVVVLGIWAVRNRGIGWTILFRRVALPVALVLLLTASWMGFYNFRVTGDPFLMPYQAHESTYGVAPIFLWQSIKPEPSYDHKFLRDFHAGWEYDYYLRQQSFSGWMRTTGPKIASFWWFVGFLFTPFLAALPRMRRRRSVQFALGVWAVLIVALLTEKCLFPHYAAPAASLAFLLVVESLRQARLAKWRGRPVGQPLVGAVMPVLLISAVTLFIVERHLEPPGWHMDRARMLRNLEQGQERHLVIVRYGLKHSPSEEWIYNRADIDSAKVVWARGMDPKAERELLEYFNDRRIWLLKADQLPRRLAAYPAGIPDK